MSDIAKIFDVLYKHGDDVPELSNREIARRCNCDEDFVRRVKHIWEAQRSDSSLVPVNPDNLSVPLGEAWKRFEIYCVHPETNVDQRTAMRIAYFHGALQMIATMNILIDRGVPAELLTPVLDRLQRECQDYFKSMG